ncbi:MAG: Hpt domain-containing protein [Methylococcales bacterium]|nr:Hpt domain-containing protein [Methylococcales bacterium]
MNAEFDTLLKQLRDEFVAEFPERCDGLEECVLAFEQGREGAFDDLYRRVHSLKGAGSQFGLSILTSICHQFESFLSSGSLTNDQLSTSYALSYVDLLKRVSDNVGNENATFHDIEHELDALRKSSMPARATVLLVEPSPSRRKLCQGVLAQIGARIVVQERGMAALEQLLHEPFDLVVAARELPDLNTVAIVAALRESNSRNKHVPVVLVSSNSTPIPDYLTINAVLARDAQFIPNLSKVATDILNQHK